MDLDLSVVDLKRLCAFTGLKIVRVEVKDYSLEFILKFRRKLYRMVLENGYATLYDNQHNKVIELCPNFSIPSQKQQPLQTIPWSPSTIPQPSIPTAPWYADIATGTNLYMDNTGNIPYEVANVP